MVSVSANEIGNKNKKVLQQFRKLDLSQELFNYAINIFYVWVSLSAFLSSINLWQLLRFYIAIFGIFLFCHAATITRNMVTKIICIAIFWSYLPHVEASVTPGIYII